MAEANSWWEKFWHEPIRAERLAIVRVCFALSLLTDQLVQYAPDLSLFFGPAGVAPAGINDGYAARLWKWPILFFHTDDMVIISSCFAVWVLATICWLIGWHTRVAGFLVWLGAMCFITRNPNLKNGGDDTLQLAAFLLMFAPCHRAFSLDARRVRKLLPTRSQSEIAPLIGPWAVRLFQLQLCMIYLTTGLAKSPGDTWWYGTSIHYVLNDVTMARVPYAVLPVPLWITAPLTWATLLFELGFPLFVLWPRSRKWTLWFGVLFHLGILATIEVGWFSFYTIAMYGAWIPDHWWQRYFGPGRVRDGRDDVPETCARGPHDYLVYYDTLCPICRKSRRMLERFDWGGRIVFRDIHDRATMEREAPGVPYARALREIIVVTPRGKVLGGFDGLRRLGWALPIAWPLLPFVYLPLVPLVARFVYRLVARNRYRLVHCDDGTCDLHLRALANANLDEQEIARIVARARGANEITHAVIENESSKAKPSA